MTKLRDFFSTIVPWPEPGQPGYINLHYTMTRPGVAGKPFWSGLPTRTVDDFLSRAAWAVKQDFIKDIYYCLSLQSEKRTDKKGKDKPVRLQKNVLSLKAVWIDVDVKEEPKGYATIEAALDAVAAFVEAAGLPPPTALVGSGGGLHIYWRSARPLSLEEWQPYAEGIKTAALAFGLRCDAGCTVDSARVLRVPGTFNRKIDPPRPVRLLGLQENDYDFETELAGIKVIRPHSPHGGLGSSDAILTGTPAATFAGLKQESLAAGLTSPETPLDPKPIMMGCAFLRDALLTGGKDYDQPMWNLTTLAATFLDDGQALAHKMGAGHIEYTETSTDELWARKLRERTDRGLGWPSCQAIQAAGSKVCATCPHFKEKKSPLHLTLVATHTPSTLLANSANIGQQIESLSLPDGFEVHDGYICKMFMKESKEEDQPPIAVPLKLFLRQLSMPLAHKDGTTHTLSFTTSLDKGYTGRVSVDLETLMGGGVDLLKTIGRLGVMTYPPNERYIKEFFMSWLSKLNEANAATKSVPFGWWVENGQRHGFVYGGLIVKDGGRPPAPAGMGDANTRDIYQPTGEIQPWIDACKLVTDQQRPELDAIIAASFAAPLMVSPAEYSALLSAWGATGVGKSTAIKVGQAVWAHPKKAKEVTRSTANSVIHKMGQLRNLPVYWDEIKNKKAQGQVFETFFAGSDGIGPGRLTSNIEQRARDDWQTMLIIAANLSFVDHVVSEQKTTAAGIYRVFEYHIPSVLPDAPGQMNSADASRITQELENNFGQVGMQYAKLLGSDPKAADAYTMAIYHGFYKRVKANKEERFWSSICGCLIAGACYANMFGAQINVERLTEFLIEAYEKNRQRLTEEATEGGTVINTTEALTGFLKAHVENTLYTDTFPVGKGKPKPVACIFGPDPNRPKPIYVQWATEARKLRIARPRFAKYMHENNISHQQILNGLKDYFGAISSYAVLGAGTVHTSGQEHIITIPIPEGSPFEAQMLAHEPKDIEQGDTL